MTMRTLCTAAVVLALSSASAGCAAARMVRGEPPAPPQNVTNPQWTKKPSPAEIQALYPTEARRLRVAGAATVQCVVQQEGGLRPCTVVSETPASMGFGEAALKAAALFQMTPRGPDGRPLRGASVTVPVSFDPPAA